ncbi:MAG: tetratricopeptide repeat protein [Deltaproteobacteria bacterium]|nr:MAG: tetratricopeptide repeat protein [Deltaproteobacteria bacterium]
MNSKQLQNLKKGLRREERKRLRKSRPRRGRLLLSATLLILFLLLAVWLGREPLARWQYSRAQRLFRQQQFSDAIGHLNWVTRLSSGKLNAQARLLTGDILDLELKQPEQAILAYLTLVRDFPRSPLAETALRRAATVYLDRLDDPAGALPLLQRLADARVADADTVRYRIADSYFRLRNYEQARIEFETLLRLYPQTGRAAEAGYRIGICLLLENRTAPAEKQLRDTAGRWPDDPFGLESLFALAGLYERRDELVRARDLLRALRGRYPDKDLLEHRLGQVEDRIRRKKKAI